MLAPAESYLEVGFNYRMTDVQAAIGLVQLRRLPEIVARRHQLAESYTKHIQEIPELRTVADPPGGHATSILYGSRLNQTHLDPGTTY